MAEYIPSTQDRGLGTLSTLPPEIRGMVYALLSCTGHTALARVSKAINEDTKSALFQHGVYRMDMEYLDESPSYSWKVRVKPSPTVLPHIKNLCVRLAIHMYGTHYTISELRYGDEEFGDDDIISVFKSTSISRADTKNSLFHKSGTAGFLDGALLSLQSRSLLSLLRQMVDHMDKPARCVIKLDIRQLTCAYVPSTVYESMELFRKFPRVVTEFCHGPYQIRFCAENFLKHHVDMFAATSMSTRERLGPEEDLDQGRDLKIIHRICYFKEYMRGDVISWGDEPQDKDYGLGEWTKALGRVWPPKSA